VEETMERAVALLGLGWIGLLGCAEGLHLADDEQGDATPAEDGEPLRDDAGRLDDGTSLDDAAPPGDVPVAPEGCPALLPGAGDVELVLAWRREIPGVWSDPGSAGLAVARDTVAVGVPTGSSTALPPQPFHFFTAEGAEPLPGPSGGEYDDWFAWCWSVAGTRVGDLAHFVGLRWAGGVPVVEAATFDPLDGTAGGAGWLFTEHGPGLRSVLDLRSVPASFSPGTALQAFNVVRGEQLSGGALTFGWLEGEPGMAGWDLAHDSTPSSSAWAAPGGWLDFEIRDDLEVAYTTSTELRLRTLVGRDLVAIPLRSPSTFTPLVAVAPAAGGSDFLVAGRSDDPAAGRGMWTERRAAGSLALLASANLGDLDERIARPEPRDLAGEASRFALAWVSPGRAGPDAPSACLYLTPLDDDGAPIGAALRIDDATAAASTPVEHVRLTWYEGAAYLLWRRAPDLWIARVDLAE
jgi:hypothetical protein